MKKIIKVKNENRYYYNTYKTIDKALLVAKLYKQEDKSNYSIVKRTKGIFVENIYDLYLHNINPLTNKMVVLQ